MTPAAELLADEIRREGSIPFRRFMEVALYHPEHGYYRKARDPFGKEGDFFTAEQVQPVFGMLMASHIRDLYRAMDRPEGFTVVELGAGRREMADAFAEWRYIGVDVDHGALSAEFEGVIFCNEFFDALPVDSVMYREGEFREQRVAHAGERFTWTTGERVAPEAEAYLRRWYPPPQEGWSYEVNLGAIEWMERAAKALRRGYFLAIDYGFTRQESVRFPAGTLMGYRRHVALDDVLQEPGARDITAHVNFSMLQETGEEFGFMTERFETLAQTILAAGEADQFAGVLAAGNGAEELRRRMQLKTLLFGLGETFRVLVLQKKA